MARPPVAYLAISISKVETQGEHLLQHVSLINDWKPAACIVSLGDTLHRHNLIAPGNDPDNGRIAALALGDAWIARELETLQNLTVPWRLMRHDEMLALDGFPMIHALVAEAVAASADLTSALAEDVDAFALRADCEGSKDFRAASAAYILEELAADIAFSQVRPYTYVYPGRPLRIYLAIQQAAERLPPTLRGLERCAFLRTRVRKGRIREAF